VAPRLLGQVVAHAKTECIELAWLCHPKQVKHTAAEPESGLYVMLSTVITPAWTGGGLKAVWSSMCSRVSVWQRVDLEGDNFHGELQGLIAVYRW
jgi:hypothetical protein